MDSGDAPARRERPASSSLVGAALYDEVLDHARRRLPPTIRRHADPEDVVQRVLLELEERSGSTGVRLHEDELRAWLFSRVNWRLMNLARDHARSSGETALSSLACDPAPPTDGTVTRADTRRLVRDLVRRLPAPYAEVVRRYALDGNTFAEVARSLGENEDAVRKRYKRACEVLGRKLEAHLNG